MGLGRIAGNLWGKWYRAHEKYPRTTEVVTGATLAAKTYGIYRYRKWRAGNSEANSGRGVDRREFGVLPRKRQRGIIYYKRQQLGDLERIYQSGYYPRRRRMDY